MSNVQNVINLLSESIRKIYKRILKIENNIDTLIIGQESKSIQEFTEKSIELQLLSDSPQYIYGTTDNEELFKLDLIIEDQNVLYINVSASFMVDTDEIETGSVMLRLKINGTLIMENETILSNQGFNNIALNYVQGVENDSLYEIEVTHEANIITTNQLPIMDLPILNTKNNGVSLSILLL